ncbi:hypothetical protein ANN_13596 [Periplaneta americana]|uniref:Uncharacterized protein n=1 Tax=Periplaneta americana TaxID=6978 RepID=A0ABQ8TND7_PERAM|nr:hypothetical protein ANN_13596 [Periplaneta americana]
MVFLVGLNYNNPDSPYLNFVVWSRVVVQLQHAILRGYLRRAQLCGSRCEPSQSRSNHFRRMHLSLFPSRSSEVCFGNLDGLQQLCSSCYKTDILNFLAGRVPSLPSEKSYRDKHPVDIDVKKIADIRKLLQYVPDEHMAFYRDIVQWKTVATTEALVTKGRGRLPDEKGRGTALLCGQCACCIVHVNLGLASCLLTVTYAVEVTLKDLLESIGVGLPSKDIVQEKYKAWKSHESTCKFQSGSSRRAVSEKAHHRQDGDGSSGPAQSLHVASGDRPQAVTAQPQKCSISKLNWTLNCKKLLVTIYEHSKVLEIQTLARMQKRKRAQLEERASEDETNKQTQYHRYGVQERAAPASQYTNNRSRAVASYLGLALRNARWFESSWEKKFSHEISASVWDRCLPSIQEVSLQANASSCEASALFLLRHQEEKVVLCFLLSKSEAHPSK